MKNTTDAMPTVGLSIEVQEFLANLGDEDLLRFFRFLPIVGDNVDEPVTTADLVYEMLLWPYVKRAARLVNGAAGVPGRLKMISDIMQASEQALEKETGRKRRVPRLISLPALLTAYCGSGLSI